VDLTQAAAAIGISKPGVIDAAKRGRLKRNDDGSFDPAEVAAYAENRRAPRGGVTRRRPAVKAVSDAAELNPVSVDGEAARRAKTVLDALLAGGMYLDRAAAELARDSFNARLKELEYGERAGKLLDADRVNGAVAAAANIVRTRFLAMPSERAPELSRLKTVAEVEDALRRWITEILEALTEALAKGF
jgi:hypothetical protein